MSTSKNTSHSVNFEGSNLLFDLLFTKGRLTLEVPGTLERFSVFQNGFSDASSNASATLEVPLEHFKDLFKIRLNTTQLYLDNFQYYIDPSMWNFDSLQQSDVKFSTASVNTYDGSLNKGPVNPTHSNQTLKRDMARHVFQAIPNVERMNNLQQFQNRIIDMISAMDSDFHVKIKERLKEFSDLGYQTFDDVSMNPLRILMSSTYLATDEDDEIGVDEDDDDEYDDGDPEVKANLITETITNAIDLHLRNVTRFAYYVDSSYNTSEVVHHGPLFLNKDTALTTAYALQRFVNFEADTVDSAALVQITFPEYSDYTFYGIPGTKYTQGSYQHYESTSSGLSDLETNVQTLVQFDIWKGDFHNYINIDFSYPFVDGDQISFLLDYVPDSLNFQIFNETFSNFGNNVIDTRTYQIFLKFKSTASTNVPEISFDAMLLSFLRSKVYEVNTMVDVVRIRIEIEIKIYHTNTVTLTATQSAIIDELKNTTSLPSIFSAIQTWQQWYFNWYLIGNPINERQVVQTNIETAKTDLETLGQTTHLIDFLLQYIE